jgi:hypothetical protein
MYDPVLGRTFQLDPHLENYFGSSPYSWTGNNPIIMIDPTGMDWYEATDKDGNVTSAFWREGSDDIEGYTNKGANYTQTIGSTSYTYTQIEVTSITDFVLSSDDWVSQEKEARADGKDVQCFQAANEMLKNKGIETTDGDHQMLTLSKDSKGVAQISKNSNTAFEELKKTVGRGDPIIVGVDYDDINENSGNVGGVTDHFVTISSVTYDLKSNSTSFGFYDPRTQHKGLKGTSSTNTLSYSNGKYTGGYYKTNNNFAKEYTLSSVRPNKKTGL